MTLIVKDQDPVGCQAAQNGTHHKCNGAATLVACILQDQIQIPSYHFQGSPW